MKKLMIMSMLAMMVSCNITETVEPPLTQEFSTVFGTKAAEPFEGTIWEWNTGNEYNMYLYFKDNKINLFYGLENNGKLERWSIYYPSGYAIFKDRLITQIEYIYYGDSKSLLKLNFVKTGNEYILTDNDMHFSYYGANASTIELKWAFFTSTEFKPWN